MGTEDLVDVALDAMAANPSWSCTHDNCHSLHLQPGCHCRRRLCMEARYVRCLCRGLTTFSPCTCDFCSSVRKALQMTILLSSVYRRCADCHDLYPRLTWGNGRQLCGTCYQREYHNVPTGDKCTCGCKQLLPAYRIVKAGPHIGLATAACMQRVFGPSVWQRRPLPLQRTQDGQATAVQGQCQQGSSL